MFVAELFVLISTLVILFVVYFKRSFTYWEKRKLTYIQPTIPFGNLENTLRAEFTPGLRVKHLYDELKKRHVPHAGLYFFSTPIYLPINLDYVKNILTKDFSHFIDRGGYFNEKNEPISAHLFALGGSRWKNLRAKLTPTFTSGKMKMMFQTLVDCEDNLHEKMETLIGEAINIKDVLGCFTTDIIGSCAFGLECNTFKDENSPFRKYGKKVFSPSKLRRFFAVFAINFPSIANMLKLKIFPSESTEFFTKIVNDTVEYREKNNYTRKDFLQLLIDLKNNKLAEEEGYKHDGKTLTMNEIVAQSFLFFLAGFETSSTTMTFALYELARNQDVQEKVRQEIRTVLAKHDGKITYDAINEMKYMTQVLNETLRKYPPVPFVTRQCVLDYQVPNQNLTIEKGIKVVIPILAIHYDEEYYPDPDKFDPERFNEENSKDRHPYAHIPFGEGPRICIGLRFGLMQSKVGLTSLLQKYKFTVNEKTQEPIKFDVNSFVLAAKGDIWLNAEKIV